MKFRDLFRSRAERERDAIGARWTASNEEKRAEGCPCGKPATHVRMLPNPVSPVPPKVYTCAEHIDVNGWRGSVPGTGQGSRFSDQGGWAGIVVPLEQEPTP